MNLVVLHGWGQDKTFWQGVFPDRPEFPVHLVDLPGFGSEPFVATDWEVADYAEWVRTWIESRQMKDVILLGHSFGGRIAGHLAAQHPSWLRALILFAAPNIYRPTQGVVWKKRLAVMARPFKSLVSRHVRDRFSSQDYKDATEARRKIYRRVVHNDQTSLLPAIRVPTLLLWGEEDKEVPLKIMEEMARLIPGAQTRVLPHVGHQAHQQSPYLFYGTIKKFIQSINA